MYERVKDLIDKLKKENYERSLEIDSQEDSIGEATTVSLKRTTLITKYNTTLNLIKELEKML